MNRIQIETLLIKWTQFTITYSLVDRQFCSVDFLKSRLIILCSKENLRSERWQFLVELKDESTIQCSETNSMLSSVTSAMRDPVEFNKICFTDLSSSIRSTTNCFYCTHTHTHTQLLWEHQNLLVKSTFSFKLKNLTDIAGS